MKISLTIGDHKVVEINNSDIFDKIDSLVKSERLIDLEPALDFEHCKIIEAYYNKTSSSRGRELNRKSTAFHFLNGVLFYHKNRLISRYQFDLGEISKLFKNKMKAVQQTFMMFGFIEIESYFAVNIFKTVHFHLYRGSWGMIFCSKFTTGSNLWRSTRKIWPKREKRIEDLLKIEQNRKRDLKLMKKDKNRQEVMWSKLNDIVMWWVHEYMMRDHWLYFLTKATYSLNEILPEWSVSILSKFHLTISSLMGIFRGLKVSSISLLNSFMSISSSSSPSFTGFFDFSARSPKKCPNWIDRQVRISRRWFFHLCFRRCVQSASRAVPGRYLVRWHQDYQPREL